MKDRLERRRDFHINWNPNYSWTDINLITAGNFNKNIEYRICKKEYQNLIPNN